LACLIRCYSCAASPFCFCTNAHRYASLLLGFLSSKHWLHLHAPFGSGVRPLCLLLFGHSGAEAPSHSDLFFFATTSLLQALFATGFLCQACFVITCPTDHSSFVLKKLWVVWPCFIAPNTSLPCHATPAINCERTSCMCLFAILVPLLRRKKICRTSALAFSWLPNETSTTANVYESN
jgi:hypothetical protein